MNILNDVLRNLRLTGTVYFQADFCAPWGMKVEKKGLANFHIVMEGRCFYRLNNESVVHTLESGDIVMFPHGSSHSLMHSVNAPVQPAETLIVNARKDDGKVVIGGTGEATKIICGHFEFDRSVNHPMIAALPPFIHLSPSQGEQPSWEVTAAQLAVAESAKQPNHNSAIVDRLAEALLMQILSGYLNQLETPTGFLKAMQDASIGHALALMHQRPEAAWTLQSIASRVGMSRSNFSATFRQVTGMSPMCYLAQWRLLRARDLLRTSTSSIAKVASLVGYQSEFAFAKAFKREFGTPPGELRRAARITAV